MRFAKIVFFIAGIYGLLALVPQYFLEGRIGTDHPPAITHPEYFYGFVGVGVAWQMMFLIIAGDPGRYRAAMLAGVIEKLSFAVAVPVLYLQQRVEAQIVGFSMIDLLLGVLFVSAFFTTRPRPSASARGV